MSMFACIKAHAISIIYDEETEFYLQSLAKPLFRSAHVPFNPNNFFIVGDDSLNAFVADGNALFVNTGTIIKSGTDDELAGVIAHEIGHIQGGHILRGKLKNQQLSEMSLASMILAGAAAVLSGRGDVGMAVMMGSQSSLLSSFLAYRVEEERSADEAAMKFLADNQISPEGMRDFMKKIDNQNIGSGIEETSYLRTHPMTQERVSFLENAVKNSPYKGKRPPSEEFKRIKAKLIAFIYPPAQALKYYKNDDSIAGKYARAVIYFKQMKKDQAISLINELIELEPHNPFFRELKAQIHMETGNVKMAKHEYKKALELLPHSALFKTNWAHAALEDSPSPTELKQLENMLNQAILVRPNYEAWLLLARTYGAQGNMASANYASAEASLRIGAHDVARRQAEQALKENKNPKLTLKLNDLLNRIDQETPKQRM